MLWGKERTVETQQHDMLDESQLSVFYPKIQEFLNQVNQIVLDKNQQTQLALCSLLAGGHILFEDLPGLGKTTLASSLAIWLVFNLNGFSLPMTCWQAM